MKRAAGARNQFIERVPMKLMSCLVSHAIIYDSASLDTRKLLLNETRTSNLRRLRAFRA
jgi:hypothetical protein